MPELAGDLLGDPDWLVRLAALRRVPAEDLVALIDDPEPEVRERARGRLTGMLLDD